MRDQYLQSHRAVEGCPVSRTCEKFRVHEGGAVGYLVEVIRAEVPRGLGE